MLFFARCKRKTFFGNSNNIFSATFNVQVATEDETILRNYVWKVLVGNMFDQVQGFLHVH